MSSPTHLLVVGELTEAGMSTRAIAAVVGVSDRTVASDQKAGAKDFAPDPQAPASAEEGEAEADAGTTVGDSVGADEPDAEATVRRDLAQSSFDD